MSRFAQPPESLHQEDCDFYTSMFIPGVGDVFGIWDLRETVDTYLGGLNFAGKRVLEIGPASGFLTIEMEKRGAEVVALEIPEGIGWDFVPFPEQMLSPIREKQIAGMPRLTNGFWLYHAANKSKAKVIYADVYNIPDLGEFDIAVMASVLQHCQNPVRIVEQCARVARTLLITERHFPELNGAVCQLEPSQENQSWHTWWRFSPTFFTQYLGVLGFADPVVTLHSHRHVWSNASLPDLLDRWELQGSRAGEGIGVAPGLTRLHYNWKRP
jgi:SAM-dependent methyltransferase